MRIQIDIGQHRLLFSEDVPRRQEFDRHEELPAHPIRPVVGSIGKDVPGREGLYIEVRAGVVSAQRVAVTGDGWQVVADLHLHGDSAVIGCFRQMLTSYGLTAPEAEGLIGAWTPWLFHNEGKRFLLRMSPADYDRQCPMRLRPTPTEVVRLGLVLTEFGPGKTQPPPR